MLCSAFLECGLVKSGARLVVLAVTQGIMTRARIDYDETYKTFLSIQAWMFCYLRDGT